WLVVAFAGIWLLILLILAYYKVKEENLHNEWEAEAKKIKGQSIAMSIAERQLKNLDQKYQPKLDKLNRQKQFIHDILPFLRK
ncbi:MAG TPA: hypothetical protein VGQ87_01040, partial [Patescibacteria group bacterium]|nr:hypothetical protein [Patescibacteria group bacterium]